MDGGRENQEFLLGIQRIAKWVWFVGRPFRYGTVYTKNYFSFLQKLFGRFIAYFCNVSEFTTRFNFEKGICTTYMEGCIEYFLFFIMITFTYGYTK